MADYYSLLARAVANLPKSAPPSARRAIYERARKALTNQLRSLKPQLPESDIAREERALDEAVAKLETEFEAAVAVAVAEAPTLAVAVSAEAPPGDVAAAERSRANVRPPPSPPVRAFEPQAFRPAPAAPRTVAPVIAPRPATPVATPRAPITSRATPAAPAVSLATPAPVAGLPNAAAFKAPLVAEAPAPAPPPPPPEKPMAEPALGAQTRDEIAPGADAPALGAPPNRYERESARPILHDPLRRRSSTWLWVAGAVAVGFAGSIAVVAWLMRPALQDLSGSAAAPEPAVAEAPAAPGKTISRVGPAPAASPTPTATQEAASPSPSPSASETQAVTRAPTPLPEPSVTPTETPAPSASPAPTAAAPSPTAAASPTTVASPSPAAPPPAATVPIASRAAMLLATVADAAKPAISVGNAVWTVVPAPPGQPQGLGVKAEIDIPDLKMHASMILRKNFDASLPASHTIDLRLTFDPGSSIKGVKDIALPLMRRDDPPAADALAGVRVKISDNYFLIGLNRADADVSKNLQEIGERGWFDFPMQLDDDRIAKLTFEKGSDGEKIVSQALGAWK